MFFAFSPNNIFPFSNTSKTGIHFFFFYILLNNKRRTNAGHFQTKKILIKIYVYKFHSILCLFCCVLFFYGINKCLELKLKLIDSKIFVSAGSTQERHPKQLINLIQLHSKWSFQHQKNPKLIRLTLNLIEMYFKGLTTYVIAPFVWRQKRTIKSWHQEPDFFF